jgi:hypothetical protein
MTQLWVTLSVSWHAHSQASKKVISVMSNLQNPIFHDHARLLSMRGRYSQRAISVNNFF